MREEFDAWWKAPEQEELRRSCAQEWGFIIWKASREAIEIALPEPHAHLIWIQAGHAPDDYWDDVAISRSEKDRCCDGSERYPVYAGWEIEETLRTAGLKVRSE